MNVSINYSKQGTDNIPITVSMHDFIREYLITSANGSIDFYNDWPYNTDCYLDITTNSTNIVNNNIEITSFDFDDFWKFKTRVYTGQNIYIPQLENQPVLTGNNVLFFTGTLRYTIPPRPISNWVFDQ
jgi:hypothetical protein